MDSEQPKTEKIDEEDALLRLWQVIGDKRRGIPGLYPVSRSTWYQGIKNHIYPQGVKISPRCTAWRKSVIKKLIEQTKNKAASE
jgi:prophage regulatory protein